MRSQDYQIIQALLPVWSLLIPDVRSVALASPDRGEVELFRQMFPNAEIIPLTVNEWDISKPATRKYDLLWCANVLMCSPDPAAWLKNISDACKHTWLLDHIEAWRCGPDGPECATFDGDVMRFHVRGHRAANKNAFDLEAFLGPRLGDQVVYAIPGSKGNNRSFVMWIKP